MADPLGEFESAIEDMLLYLDTAFGTRWREVNNERNAMLRNTEELFQVPFLEVLPTFRSSGLRPGELAQALDGLSIDGGIIADFVSMMECGLLRGIAETDGAMLHRHQTNLLREGASGRHCVITSPTGSGKTEAFLMPLLLHLAGELRQAADAGPAPAPPAHRNDWWWGGRINEAGNDEPQLYNPATDAPIREWWDECWEEESTPYIPSHSGNDGHRLGGLRALIIYPMNALVDDQMRRLRLALDSAEMHELYANMFRGHTPRFARYNSSTIGRTTDLRAVQSHDGYLDGTYTKSGLAWDIRDQIELPFRDMYRALRGEDPEEWPGTLMSAAHALDGRNPEDGFFVQNPWGCEQRFRWDIQSCVPDVLVTNLAQLNVLASRTTNADEEIFAQTREYLATEGAKFHLVLDELHLYRDSSGTETALSLRIILERLGLLPGQEYHDRLQILASSASLDSGDEGTFLSEFFGVPFHPNQHQGEPGFFVEPGALAEVNGQDIEQVALGVSGLPVDPDPFVQFATSEGSPSDQHELCDALGVEGGELPVRMRSLLVDRMQYTNNMLHGTQEPIHGGGGYRFRPSSLWDLASLFFGLEEPEVGHDRMNSQAWQAMRGLLRARSILQEHGTDHGVARCRIHTMVRNVQGLSGIAEPSVGVPAEHSVDALNEQAASTRKVGRLVPSQSGFVEVDGNEYRSLELHYCDVCNDVFFGGYRSRTNEQHNHWAFGMMDADPAPDDARAQSAPLRVEQQNHLDYALFWPRGQQRVQVDVNMETNPNGLRLYGPEGINGRYQWMPCRLNPTTGEVRQVLGHPSPTTGWPNEHNAQHMELNGFTVQGFTPRVTHHCVIGEDGTVTDQTVPCNYTVGSGSDPVLRRLRALPPHCPSCSDDREYAASGAGQGLTSPIRGFRTSFEEVSNQHIRSLFVGLPASPARKLIAFSDSRDRAARLSLNIARRHQDLSIAVSVLERARRLVMHEPELLRRRIEGEQATAADERFLSRLMQPAEGQAKEFTGDLVSDGDMQVRLNLYENPMYAENILARGPGAEQGTDQRLFYPLRECLTANMNFTSLARPLIQAQLPMGQHALPPLAKSLLLQGMNPAGLSVPAQDPTGAGERDDAWVEALGRLQHDPPRGGTGWTSGLGVEQPMDGLMAEDLANALLSGRNTPHDAGLGWFELECNNTQLRDNVAHELGLAPDVVHSILMGYVQFLLRKRRYSRPTAGEGFNRPWADANQPIPFQPFTGRGYFQAVAENLASNGTPVTVLPGHENDGPARSLFELLVGRIPVAQQSCALLRPGGAYGDAWAQTLLQPHYLRMRLAEDTEAMVYCSTCLQPHYLEHAARHRTCTRCFARLQVNDPAQQAPASWLQARNQLANRLRDEERHQIPLRTEELTGQTDDYHTRQRHFRGIFTQEESDLRIIKEIDVLSVTTTVEVGVDLGSLNAVYLSNMPPRRFNYQQRVGRAGRRGQAFSEARTACRDSSHDAHYYRHPERITGDPCPSPRLSMNQRRIAQRVFAKECLRRAFRQASVLARVESHGYGLKDMRPPDSHGEFGRLHHFIADNGGAPDPTENAIDVEAWLGVEGNVRSIATALHHGLQHVEWTVNDLTEYATSGTLFQQICAVIHDVMDFNSTGARDSGRDLDYLAQTLAEHGVLPMANMPTEVRDLYHAKAKREIGTISRPIEQAITMFAPGAVITKDKQKHRVLGITPSIQLQQGRSRNTATNEDPPWSWRNQLTIDLSTNALIHVGDPMTMQHHQPWVQDTRTFVGVKPQAFRSRLDRLDRDMWSQDGGMASHALMYHRSAGIEGAPIGGARHAIDAGEDGGMVYLMNDNHGRGFRFQHVKERGGQVNNPLRDDLNHQWLEQSVVRDHSEFFANPGPPPRIAYMYPQEQESFIEDVALVAPKVTDVYWVHPDGPREGLVLDPYLGGRARPGVRAAYRSAAYILRAALCDELDVDPSELEIVNLAPIAVADQRLGRIILSDKNPNGSGYAVALRDRLSDIMAVIRGEEAHGEWAWLRLLSDPASAHDQACRTSCTECIRYYTNQGEHGLMDWRLGLDMLRLLSDPEDVAFTDCLDLAEALGQLPEHDHRRDLLSTMQSLAQRLVGASGTNSEVASFGGLPAVVDHDRHVLHILVHPLWDTQTSGVVEAARFEAMDQGFDVDQIRFVDTFNAERRPGWSLAGLVN